MHYLGHGDVGNERRTVGRNKQEMRQIVRQHLKACLFKYKYWRENVRVGELEVFKDKPVKKHQRIFEQNSNRV